MNFLDQDEMYAWAGEYALGVLTASDKEAFEQELQRNHKLAAAVAFWNDRLLEITPLPVAVVPTADLWKRIDRDLPKRAVPSRFGSLWNSMTFWRVSSMASIAASILLAVRMFTAPETGSLQYVAMLQAPEQGPTWIVEVHKKTLVVRPLAPVAVGTGKALQFWTKPEGAANPTSLGLVAPTGPTAVALNRLPGVSRNQLFEITLEPENGSPISRPTGPILAIGKAVPF